MGRLFAIFLVVGFKFFHVQALIEQVDDSDLVHFLIGERSFIVLFTKNNCQECDKLESVLENVESDLKDNLKAVVVKAHNSHMVTLYNPTKEPALIYFRRGTPLLYYGSHNAQDILQTFAENREPIVKELSDINFEHLTQAASGATTGDWYIFFYSADCVYCLRLNAIWEAVGAHFKHRLNVARIDRLGTGIATAKRFGIVESPEFVFLRQGKVYRYKKKLYAAGNLIEFAEKDFMKQANPEIVPPESINLGGYIDTIKNSYQFWMLPLGILLSIVLVCVKYMSFNRMTVKDVSKKAK